MAHTIHPARSVQLAASWSAIPSTDGDEGLQSAHYKLGAVHKGRIFLLAQLWLLHRSKTKRRGNVINSIEGGGNWPRQGGKLGTVLDMNCKICN